MENNTIEKNGNIDKPNVDNDITIDISSLKNEIVLIGEKSKLYKKMHLDNSYKLSHIYDMFSYMGIAIGPISGLISGINSFIHPEDHILLPIIASIFAFVSGILVAITKFGKYEERSYNHKLAASKYTSLESNVRRHLLIINTDNNILKYIEWLGNSFDNLFLASPLIEKRIHYKYKKGCIDETEYNTVSINKEYQDQKLQEILNMTPVNNPRSLNNNDEKDARERHYSSFNGNDIVKRSEFLSHFVDINLFSDGRMDYEMSRMLNM